MDRENDDVITDFDQTNDAAPGLEGDADAGGATDDDVANPFEVLTGDDTLEQDDTEEDDSDEPFGLGSDDTPGA